MNKSNEKTQEYQKFARSVINDEPIYKVVDRQLSLIQSVIRDTIKQPILCDTIQEELAPIYHVIDVTRLLLFTRIEAEISELQKIQLAKLN